MSDWRDQIPAPLGRAVRWWLGELAKLVPEAARGRYFGKRSRLVLVVDGPGDNLLEETDRHARRVGRIDGDELSTRQDRRGPTALSRAKRNGGRELTLRFSADRSLRAPISLPLAAEKNVHEVIGFEFERLVPFSRADVYYTHRILARDKQARTLRLELVVLRRADVAKLGPAVEPLGLRIARLEVAGAGFEGGVIPIPMHDRESDRSMGGERKIEIGLVAIAGVLGFLCLAVPYWRTSVAIESLTAQMADMRQQAGALASLKKQIDSKQLDAQFLSDRKRSMPTATELLAELTRLIPDDTYLTELSIAGDRLRLVGAANSATAILTLIAQNPAFHGAAFQSPIVQDQRLNRERFDIAVRAVQRDGQ